mgnify:CR=1 FL=1
MAGNLPMINAIFYDTAYAALVQGVLLPPHPGCPFRPLEDIGNIDNGEASFLVALEDRQAFLEVFSRLINERLEKKGFLFLLSMGIDEVQTKREEIQRFIDLISQRCRKAAALIVPSREGYPLENRYSLANAFYLFAQLGDTRMEAHLPNRSVNLIGIKRVAPGIAENTERVLWEVKRGIVKMESPEAKGGTIADKIRSYLESSCFSQAFLDEFLNKKLLGLDIPDADLITLTNLPAELNALSEQVRKLPDGYARMLGQGEALDGNHLLRQISGILDIPQNPLFSVRQALAMVCEWIASREEKTVPEEVDTTPLASRISDCEQKVERHILHLRSKEKTIKIGMGLLVASLVGVLLRVLPMRPVLSTLSVAWLVLIAWFCAWRFFVRRRVRSCVIQLREELDSGMAALKDSHFRPALETLASCQVATLVQNLLERADSQCGFIRSWEGQAPEDVENRYFHPLLDKAFSISEHDPEWKRLVFNWKNLLSENALNDEVFSAFVQANQESLRKWLDQLAFNKPAWFAENETELRNELLGFSWPCEEHFPLRQTIFAIPWAFPDFIIPDQQHADFALLETKLEFFHVKLV